MGSLSLWHWLIVLLIVVLFRSADPDAGDAPPGRRGHRGALEI